MAGELISMRVIVNEQICLDCYVMEVDGADTTFWSQYEKLSHLSRSDDPPLQFRFPVPETSLESESEGTSLPCHVGKERDGATVHVEVGGALKCSACCDRFGNFIAFKLNTSTTLANLRVFCKAMVPGRVAPSI